MRIAILTDDAFDSERGITTMLDALLGHAPADIEPHVYGLARHPREGIGYTAMRSWRLPTPGDGQMQVYAPRLSALRRRFEKDDVRAIHLATPGPAGLAARRLAHALGLPLVGSYHPDAGDYMTGLSRSPHVRTLLQGYLRWAYARCHRVLVPSESTGRLLAGGRWPHDRLRVWTGGVDSTSFAPLRRSAAVRESWRASERTPAILYALRESSDKDVAFLGRLQRLLDDHGLPHRWVVAGTARTPCELRRTLPEAVFTGMVPREGMGEIMASADVLVVPSETDAAAHMIVQAQACGLPVLVTDRGSARENVTDGATGHICRAGDERDFCWRLAQLLVDPARRRAMSNAARHYGVSRGWAQSMQPLWASYREAVLHSRAVVGAARASAAPAS